MVLYKKRDPINPANYHPFTCLNNLHKALTSCLLKRFNLHVGKYGLFDPQQQGVHRNHLGCHENLLIDRIIMDELHLCKRNLSYCWIDYRKAFDSIFSCLHVVYLQFAMPFQLLLARTGIHNYNRDLMLTTLVYQLS